jgi:hypothetical protein
MRLDWITLYHMHHPRRASVCFEVRLDNPSSTCFYTKQAVISQHVSHIVILPVGFVAQSINRSSPGFEVQTKKSSW